MMMIAANALKKGGVSVLQNVLSKAHEAVITVRGQQRYVVMNIESYESLREAELERALQEAREDINKGQYVSENVTKHIKRITQ